MSSLHWNYVEATGEVDSQQSEPIGIFLKANYFKLFTCFAGRVYQTSRIKWEDNDEAREILSA